VEGQWEFGGYTKLLLFLLSNCTHKFPSHSKFVCICVNRDLIYMKRPENGVEGRRLGDHLVEPRPKDGSTRRWHQSDCTPFGEAAGML
jgi:hypothetical protein